MPTELLLFGGILAVSVGGGIFFPLSRRKKPNHHIFAAKHIQRTTDDLLQVEHGSLYPALHRLERKGWIAAKWEPAGKDLKREFKYDRLTAAGRKQLVAEESKWKQLTSAIARLMWPAREG